MYNERKGTPENPECPLLFCPIGMSFSLPAVRQLRDTALLALTCNGITLFAGLRQKLLQAGDFPILLGKGLVLLGENAAVFFIHFFFYPFGCTFYNTFT